MNQINPLAEAIEIVREAQRKSTNLIAVWRYLDTTLNYLNNQLTEALHQAGVADANRYLSDKAIYGAELAEQWAAEDEFNPLNWDVTKINNYKQNFPDAGTPDNPQWNEVTMALVWLSIPCAWGWELTEKNYREAFVRIHIYEHLRGAMRSREKNGKAEEVYITLEDVRKHIGLKVNVSEESKTKFHSKMMHTLREEATREMMHQLQQATVKA